MSNLITITDVGNGHVQVSWQQGMNVPRFYPHQIPFSDPLTDKDRSELRWYLEDYLQFPYGAEENRAKRVETKMEEWGAALFSMVFVQDGSGADPRTFYQEAVRLGLDQCDICVSSDDAAFLNMPWELLRDSSPGRGYLAFNLCGLYRRRSSQAVQAPVEMAYGGPFRILMVIARPVGDPVPMTMVARSVVEALRPYRDRIELELLRPPTLDALQRKLTDQPGRYQMVHFDGHGVFADGNVIGAGVRSESGHLLFEKRDGQRHLVTAQDIGTLLANCRVPIFVMNACQSGWEGGLSPFSSVAAQLVGIGARAVIGMSYSVYGATADKFMGRLYEALVEHSPLSSAVAAARKLLMAEPERPSVVGPLVLRDWVVPVLHLDQPGFTPMPAKALPEPVEEDAQPKQFLEYVRSLLEEGQYGFIGRDKDLLRIEQALRDPWKPVVLITGVAGIGKTSLAYAFGRWYAETAGCPGGVYRTSFRSKADFGQIIGSIVGYGTDFSSLPDKDQFDLLTKHLKEAPSLLVWDNFETVAGYPEGQDPFASEAERNKISRFLRALKGGKSRVVITTRKNDEDWLNAGYTILECSGLGPWDASQLAEEILKRYGKSASDYRGDLAYRELVAHLNGHPRTMEVVLPLLRRQSPEAILKGLQQGESGAGRSFADSAIAYAFDNLSEKTRRYLPLVGLFVIHVEVDLLEAFCGDDDAECTWLFPQGLPNKAGWESILMEAAQAGLLRHLGNDRYECHPVLPGYLRSQIAETWGFEAMSGLDDAFVRLMAALSSGIHDALQRGDKNALGFVAFHEPNVLRALRVATLTGQWSAAQQMAQTTSEMYETQGRFEELQAFHRSLLDAVGRAAPVNDPERANLWMFLVGNEANDAISRNNVVFAEECYLRILDYLTQLSEAARLPHMAAAYHQLGIVAEERSDFDQAEKWYRKALSVREAHGLERDAASDYHNLGLVAQERSDFDQAETWYRKALIIYERLGLERDAASDYHQLGRVAAELSDFDQAETWYRKALEIRERLGLERDAASDYHNLGSVAQERSDFELAEMWYRKALEIYERLGLERDAAGDYHQLGRVAQERSDFELAEMWYRKALEIYERLGTERYAATVYHQLGTLAQELSNVNQAVQWYRMALEIFKRLGLELDAAAVYHQLGIVAQQRSEFDQANQCFRKALAIFERQGHPPLQVDTLGQLGVFHVKKGDPGGAVIWFAKARSMALAYNMPVLLQILVHLARLLGQLGDHDFTTAWRSAYPDEDPPIEELKEVLSTIDKSEE